jgi:hypothetical protein
MGKLQTLKKLLKATTAKKTPTLPKRNLKNRRFKPRFHSTDQILLVGEGNFSYTLAIATTIEDPTNITATAFDSETILAQKYPEALAIIQTLLDLGVTILVPSIINISMKSMLRN